MNAYQGNLDLAKGNVTDAVNDYMYDYEQETNRYKFIYDYYGDWVDSLEADQKTELDRAYAATQKTEDEAREDLEYKQDLWTRAAEQGVNIPFSNLKDLTTEEAAKLYAESVSAQVATERAAEDGVAKEMTDENIRAQIVLDVGELGGKKDEATYNRLRAEITLNENILNQDRALFILDEQFGKAGGKTFDQWKAGEPATEDIVAEPVIKPSLFGGTTAGDLPEGKIIRDAQGKIIFGTSTTEADQKAKEEEANKKVREMLAGSPLTRRSQFIFSPENLKITNLYK